MKQKKESKVFLACGVLSAFAIAIVSMSVVNAEESIRAERVAVQSEAALVENQQTISTGQITTGETSERNNDISYTTNENIESSPIVETWVPKATEEKKYYSYVGTEKLAVKTSGTSGVKAANSVQGPLCQKAFESVLGDYLIARTYNIFPGTSNLNKPIYELKDEVEITMEIPKTLQKEGRTFEMICVSNGKAHVLKDTDTSGTSITIKTKYFYAYALCYKDK